MIAPTVLQLNDLVQAIQRMLRRLIGEDVQLHTVLDADLGLVRADAGQMEQVIVNLVVNARDAMPKGGLLTIETANVRLQGSRGAERLDLSPGDYAMVAVSDTGTGMDAVTQASIFEPFFTTKEVGEGTGLGLATVYGIVQQSGGGVYVYSEPGRGTSFKVYLPRVSEAETVAPESVSDRAGPAEWASILLVEDDGAVRGLVMAMLIQAGYEVISAASEEEALRLVDRRAEPLDLLLTDVVMPGLNGRELAEKLQARRPGLPVLYMSGYADDHVIRTGVLPAGSAFLAKPFSMEVLLRSVRAVLRARVNPPSPPN